jgi:hypothetical protein
MGISIYSKYSEHIFDSGKQFCDMQFCSATSIDQKINLLKHF